MRVLVIFATTEGHTREICQFAAERLRAAGHTVAVEEATRRAEAAQIEAYDGVILAGSLHVGRFQAALIHFAASHRAALAAKPSVFISVSLSAAGEAPEDWAGVEQAVATFEQETGWTPGAVHHAAGAIKYSQYDFFKRLTIQHIAAQRGRKTTRSHDYDLTDYEALERFILDWAARLPSEPRGTPAPASRASPD